MTGWLPPLLMSLSLFPAVQRESQVVLEDFLTPAEINKYQGTSSYKERMDLLRKVLDRQSRKITSLVKQRLLRESTELLQEIQSAAQLGLEENRRAVEQGGKDLRSKPVRKLEIKVRKLTETLNELKVAVPYESRIRFEETAEQLESFRDRLLNQLFEQSLSFHGNLPLRTERSTVEELPPLATSWLPSSVQSRVRGATDIRGDQFTEEEYDKVQEAQELEKRVEVFLEIAEARLVEIERRMKEDKWDKKDPNPLEFFTYAQMMHAYWRALEGIMINIDEKAKYKLAEPKEIKKSLKALNKKIQDFIPRLEPVRQLSIDLKDEELYGETRKGMKASDTALKGSQMGLGAPAEN